MSERCGGEPRPLCRLTLAVGEMERVDVAVGEPDCDAVGLGEAVVVRVCEGVRVRVPKSVPVSEGVCDADDPDEVVRDGVGVEDSDTSALCVGVAEGVRNNDGVSD
jgi:hypothetical protein